MGTPPLFVENSHKRIDSFLYQIDKKFGVRNIDEFCNIRSLGLKLCMKKLGSQKGFVFRVKIILIRKCGSFVSIII